MARRGHTVTILTSQYDPSLPTREVVDKVRIVRAPVVARISKGVIMPTIGWLATALALNHDAMSLHLPQFDASGIALRGRALRQPVVLTYHCDLLLPPGLINKVANVAVDVSNRAAGTLATRIVAYTHDYADNSPFLSSFREKIEVIPPAGRSRHHPRRSGSRLPATLEYTGAYYRDGGAARFRKGRRGAAQCAATYS